MESGRHILDATPKPDPFFYQEEAEAKIDEGCVE
jgi:hypothetical protein